MNGRNLFIVVVAGLLPFLFCGQGWALEEGDLVEREGCIGVYEYLYTDEYQSITDNPEDKQSTCTDHYHNDWFKKKGWSGYWNHVSHFRKVPDPCDRSDSDGDGVCNSCDQYPNEPDPQD